MVTLWKGSVNYSVRLAKVDRIVIHWFGIGTIETAKARFQGKANKVSAHYGISKGRVWQWVGEGHAAWHAGNSAMNHRSIGIEHDATTAHNLSEGDYQLSGLLVGEIAKRHNIPLDRDHIIGHQEIKPTQCPGTINIDRIIAIARGAEGGA
jgi:N-acetyl-anhydromuramyl-L-alanine amidase AmpD